MAEGVFDHFQLCRVSIESRQSSVAALRRCSITCQLVQVWVGSPSAQLARSACESIASGSRLSPSLEGQHWCGPAQQARLPDRIVCVRVGCCWDRSTCRWAAARPSAGRSLGLSVGLSCPELARPAGASGTRAGMHRIGLLWLQDTQVPLAAPVGRRSSPAPQDEGGGAGRHLWQRRGLRSELRSRPSQTASR